MFALSIFYGCVVDYTSTTELRICNNSTHDVSVFCLMPRVADVPIGFTIESGSEYKWERSVMDDVAEFPHLFRVLVSFDNQKFVLHQLSDGDAYHNFCEESFYEVKQTDKRHRRYTFTFTDEDYEYALANPAPDDVIKEIEGVK